MAKLSLSILEHQKRRDDSYPISIRIGHLSKSAYIETGKYAKSWQVAKVKGKKGVLTITDRHLLFEMLTILEGYDKELKTLGMVTQYDIKQISEHLQSRGHAKKREEEHSIDFISYSRQYAQKISAQGKVKSANLFNTLLNSVEDYISRPFLFTREINKQFLEGYRDFLLKERTITRLDQKGIKRTKKVPPIGQYGMYGRMKDFRTLFNRIKADYNDEDTGYIPIPQNPFKAIKISSPEPQPRGLEMVDVIALYKLYEQYESMMEREKLGIDSFFLSFFLIGLNTIDLYNLQRREYKKGRLLYNRTKTEGRRKDAAFISIKVEPEAEKIMQKYLDEENSDYLFALHNKYSLCDNLTRAINMGLNSLCEKNNLKPVTMYVARHSWASIARNECAVSKDDISLALNHRSADKGSQVTDIYLRKDWSMIDRANRKVIDYLIEQL